MDEPFGGEFEMFSCLIFVFEGVRGRRGEVVGGFQPLGRCSGVF